MKTIALIFTLLFILISCKNDDKNSAQKIIRIIEKDTIRVIDSTIIKERKYDNLSQSFDFKLTYYEKYVGKNVTKHYWDIIIYNKQGKKIDSIRQNVNLFYSSLVNLDNVRSYRTGINIDKEAVDNYYGDFIVADFNFDHKDDFTIINDLGGNGGTFYSYYIQESNRKFNLNKFLTDSIVYFPAKINSKNKTLVTYIHAGVCGLGEHIYKLDHKSNIWTEKRHRIINVCKE
ncbi:XAC2610-related protein [Flavobacterium sp.]|uniref:XAC2610-related protein n=1 Tax=Flavobacterium sp. TaxID=239 RepID=UPI00286D6403|nr:hypothetical protein [Flavobacterium sp.]